MKELVFTFLAPFGGCGAGARGFLDASVALPNLGVSARWECLGGIDIDSQACADFYHLTGVEQWCRDMATLTPAEVRARWPRAPNCVFTSAPCQGGSGLLSSKKAKAPKYQDMNNLALTWARLMIESWDEPPPLLIFENVPRLVSRAPEMVAELRRLLRAAGYKLGEQNHDCGELGGLAQHRRRWLLFARLPRRCPPVLYRPPHKRVRGCGEVLSALPVPATVEARAWGPMHVMPRLAMVNWIRLALIPAGGDWRDLEGVLAEGEARREKFKRHAVERWDEPVGTIAADTGSNGVANVADPRVLIPQAGNADMHHGKYRVHNWADPSLTVHGATRVGSGAPSVADPRVSTGYDAAYAVLGWNQAARTIAAKSAAGCGAYAVADPRLQCEPRAGAYGVLRWDEAAKVVTGSLSIDNGFGAVADPRKPPDFTPVILARDGTWHRPLTTLELAALQGFPLVVNGKPLLLQGGSTRQRKAIGNAVPPPAARAIAEQMLMTLAHGALESFALSSEPVLVEPREALHA